MLLGECLVTAALKPAVLAEDVVVAIERAFVLAAGAASGYYRQNVIDRCQDFLVLKELGVFGPFNGIRSRRAMLLVFNLVARNLRREFERESLFPEDAGRGFIELRELTLGCRAVCDYLRDIEFRRQRNWDQLSAIWKPIGAHLTAVVDTTKDESQGKDKLRATAERELGELWPRIENTAKIVHVSVSQPESHVGWGDELVVAASSCFALPLLRREELPEVEDVLGPITLEEEVTSTTIAPHETAMVTEDLVMDHGMTLEQEVQEAINQLGEHSPEEIEYLREDIRLQREHPGRCVAFVDLWDTIEGAPHLTRQVLATGEDELELEGNLQEAMERRTELVRGDVERMFVEDPEEGIVDRFNCAAES